MDRLLDRRGSRRSVLAALAGAGAWILPVRSGQAQDALFSRRGFPYDAFDALTTDRIDVGGGTVLVGIAQPVTLSVGLPAIRAWVEESAKTVAAYYARFPVPTARILVLPRDGADIGGTTWGYRGAAASIRLGRDVGTAGLADDWVMVHEMLHMGVPDLDGRHAWFSEGVATYCESIARVRAGDLKAERMWAEMMRGLNRGLPGPGDHGLDDPQSHGRTYWGGALFCFLADVALRQGTGNRAGFETALRGINKEADHTIDWPLQRVLATADAATGTTVLSSLYAEHGRKPVTPDLPALWRDLGISTPERGSAAFDDSAPLAAIRRAITAPS